MGQTIDGDRVHELIVQSRDMHSDAMRVSKAALDDYVDAAGKAREVHQRWSPALRAAMAAGAAAGVAALAWGGPAWADTTTDIQMLQTAASLENLAVSAYTAALALPIISAKGTNTLIKNFVTNTITQHAEHARAFNSAVLLIGGKEQQGPNPRYSPTVQQALPALKGPADVVGLGLTLEDVAAQSYVKYVGMVGTPDLRRLFSSVAGVEAQHKTTLLIMSSLLAGNNADLIATKPNLAALPSEVGTVGIPDTTFPTGKASPPEEGVVP